MPPEELNADGPMEKMSHEPLVFLSGAFKGTPVRWSSVDRERFAVVATFLRLPNLFWDGAYIIGDRGNLAYISNPEACTVLTASKATAQRVQRWGAFACRPI